MDILSLIDKFIQWCDGNVGFLTNVAGILPPLQVVR